MLSDHGYVKVRVGVGHPLADPNGFAYEHVLVWVSAYGPVPQAHVIHHRNEDKTDNRLRNLELLTRGQHNHHHTPERDDSGRFVGKKAAGRELDGQMWNEIPGAEDS